MRFVLLLTTLMATFVCSVTANMNIAGLPTTEDVQHKILVKRMEMQLLYPVHQFKHLYQICRYQRYWPSYNFFRWCEGIIRRRKYC